jgi:hypothetical protein
MRARVPCHVLVLAALGVAAVSGCMAWRQAAPLLGGLGGNGASGIAVTTDATGTGLATARGGAEIRLLPRVDSGRFVQVVKTAHASASIATLSVAAYVETTTDTYKPIKASTGEPAEPGDSGLLVTSVATPAINFERGVVFKNLKPSKKYRFIARAYASGGGQISDDSRSSVDLTVADDDRPALATLPLRLVDLAFSATASVNLTITGSPAYTRVDTQLYTVVDATETPVSGNAPSIDNPASGATLTFSNLRANTTYRLRGTLMQNSTTVGSGYVNISVTTDDAPGPFTLTLTAS